MVDMNVIILEGIALYIVLAIILFMMISIAALVFSGIKQDEKIEMQNAEITQLNKSNDTLSRENFRYRLRYGELEPRGDIKNA